MNTAWIGVENDLFAWAFLFGQFERTYGVMSNSILLAVPYFIFMGTMLEKSRLAEDLLKTIGKQEEALIEWTQEGGLLLRFAGPQMAASDLSRSEEHPLMPIADFRTSMLGRGGASFFGSSSGGRPGETIGTAPGIDGDIDLEQLIETLAGRG